MLKTSAKSVSLLFFSPVGVDLKARLEKFRQKHQLVTTITAMIITGSPDQPRWWAEDRALTWKSDKSES
jgi:hypothetical protein